MLTSEIAAVDGVLSRRRTLALAARAAVCSFLLPGLTGCTQHSSDSLVQPDLIWGRKGLSDGRLMKPRAMAIDAEDNIYLVDMTGRIQIFDRDGNYRRGWRTPEILQGRPTGLGIALDGSLLVADTHYYRLLNYERDGTLRSDRTIGGQFGDEPSQFHFVTDVVQDSKGHIFAGQYGELDQIQEFDADGQFVRRWGNHGSGEDGFDRPQGLLLDEADRLWVADACNHRVLLFDLQPKAPRLIQSFGQAGTAPGHLQYPYGIVFDKDGTLLVAEYGNHRVQRFSRAGESLGMWGEPGTGPGQLDSPWAVGVDSRGSIHVLDSLNHRVQRFAPQKT